MADYEAPEPKGEARLYTRALLCRTLYETEPARMREQWVAEVLHDPVLLIGLLGGEEKAAQAALDYLDTVDLEVPPEEPSEAVRRALQTSIDKQPSPRGIAARLRAKMENASSILQTYRVRDGRLLGSLRYGDLPRLIERGAHEDWMLLKLYQSCSALPSAVLADVVRDADVTALLHSEPDMNELTEFLAHRKETAPCL